MTQTLNQPLPPVDQPAVEPVIVKSRPARRWKRFIPGVLVIAFLVGITFPGIAYRTWAWEFTQPGRFQGDINRNYMFGLSAMKNGFLNIYENEIRDDPPRDLKLDYPPLRLFTFEMWAKWNQRDFPNAKRWSRKYQFTSPLLHYYTTLEWLASFAALMIVLTWLRQCRRAELPMAESVSPWTGVVRAMLAFSLLWFDPGVAIIAHGWPSPNMWAIPFYLWAVLLCLWDWWFVAGIVMGIGAMLQGQLTFVAGLFILWPLFSGRPARALRYASGFFAAFMGVASGWMVTTRPDVYQLGRAMNWQAVSWVVMSVGLLAVVGLRGTLRRRFDWKWFILPAVSAMIVLILPALKLRDGETIVLTISAAVIAIGAFWYFNWPIKRYLVPLSLAICLMCCIPFFNAGTSWWDIGFRYGAERFENVAGRIVNNLPSLVEVFGGYENIHDTAFTIPKAWFHGWPAEATDVNIRQVLFTIYIVFFIAAAGAMARQWRRKDRSFLIAAVLPWVLFFTILPQMSPRYAVFAAGVGAICIGRAFGMTMLSLLFTALTIIQTGLCMIYGNHIGDDSTNPLFNNRMKDLFEHLNPGIAWAEVLAACVFFWIAWAGEKRVRAVEAVPVEVATSTPIPLDYSPT